MQASKEGKQVPDLLWPERDPLMLAISSSSSSFPTPERSLTSPNSHRNAPRSSTVVEYVNVVNKLGCPVPPTRPTQLSLPWEVRYRRRRRRRRGLSHRSTHLRSDLVLPNQLVNDLSPPSQHLDLSPWLLVRHLLLRTLPLRSLSLLLFLRRSTPTLPAHSPHSLSTTHLSTHSFHKTFTSQ